MGMRRGAVALLDALGFKGIWKDAAWAPEDVIKKLNDAKSNAEVLRAEDSHEGFDELLSVRFHFLSDTVVIVSETGPAGGERDPFEEIEWLCTRVAEFTESMLGIQGKPAMAYRGAVAYGDFLIDEPFILGPAVDEVAEAERLAEGAFVWLCPSALREIRSRRVQGTTPYAVPMKSGQAFTTLVVPPVYDVALGSRDILDGVSQAFRMPNPRVDVQVKYQNTIRMVEMALRADAKEQSEAAAWLANLYSSARSKAPASRS